MALKAFYVAKRNRLSGNNLKIIDRLIESSRTANASSF